MTLLLNLQEALKEHRHYSVLIPGQCMLDGGSLKFPQQFGRPHAGDYKLRIQSCIRAYHKACTHD